MRHMHTFCRLMQTLVTTSVGLPEAVSSEDFGYPVRSISIVAPSGPWYIFMKVSLSGSVIVHGFSTRIVCCVESSRVDQRLNESLPTPVQPQHAMSSPVSGNRVVIERRLEVTIPLPLTAYTEQSSATAADRGNGEV